MRTKTFPFRLERKSTKIGNKVELTVSLAAFAADLFRRLLDDFTDLGGATISSSGLKEGSFMEALSSCSSGRSCSSDFKLSLP